MLLRVDSRAGAIVADVSMGNIAVTRMGQIFWSSAAFILRQSKRKS